MKYAPLVKLAAGLAGVVLVAACETTGDPRQGGLFGWSEEKAKQRLDEKQETLDDRQSRLAREKQAGAGLRQTEKKNRMELDRQAADLAAILKNVDRLERDSPTSSGASRARKLRAEIERIRRDETLRAEDRRGQIHALSRSVDRLQAELGLQAR